MATQSEHQHPEDPVWSVDDLEQRWFLLYNFAQQPEVEAEVNGRDTFAFLCKFVYSRYVGLLDDVQAALAAARADADAESRRRMEAAFRDGDHDGRDLREALEALEANVVKDFNTAVLRDPFLRAARAGNGQPFDPTAEADEERVEALRHLLSDFRYLQEPTRPLYRAYGRRLLPHLRWMQQLIADCLPAPQDLWADGDLAGNDAFEKLWAEFRSLKTDGGIDGRGRTVPNTDAENRRLVAESQDVLQWALDALLLQTKDLEMDWAYLQDPAQVPSYLVHPPYSDAFWEGAGQADGARQLAIYLGWDQDEATFKSHLRPDPSMFPAADRLPPAAVAAMSDEQRDALTKTLQAKYSAGAAARMIRTVEGQLKKRKQAKEEDAAPAALAQRKKQKKGTQQKQAQQLQQQLQQQQQQQQQESYPDYDYGPEPAQKNPQNGYTVEYIEACLAGAVPGPNEGLEQFHKEPEYGPLDLSDMRGLPAYDAIDAIDEDAKKGYLGQLSKKLKRQRSQPPEGQATLRGGARGEADEDEDEDAEVDYDDDEEDDEDDGEEVEDDESGVYTLVDAIHDFRNLRADAGLDQPVDEHTPLVTPPVPIDEELRRPYQPEWRAFADRYEDVWRYVLQLNAEHWDMVAQGDRSRFARRAIGTDAALAAHVRRLEQGLRREEDALKSARPADYDHRAKADFAPAQLRAWRLAAWRSRYLRCLHLCLLALAADVSGADFDRAYDRRLEHLIEHECAWLEADKHALARTLRTAAARQAARERVAERRQNIDEWSELLEQDDPVTSGDPSQGPAPTTPATQATQPKQPLKQDYTAPPARMDLYLAALGQPPSAPGRMQIHADPDFDPDRPRLPAWPYPSDSDESEEEALQYSQPMRDGPVVGSLAWDPAAPTRARPAANPRSAEKFARGGPPGYEGLPVATVYERLQYMVVLTLWRCHMATVTGLGMKEVNRDYGTGGA